MPISIKDQSYILVTPVKNEGAFIPNLISSIKKQSIKPILWVIVDDGSTDETPQIIDTEAARTGWIEVVRLPLGTRKRGQHYAYVCKQGFNYAVDKLHDWDFIGLVDADMVLENKYFEMLMGKFGEIEELGIASGGIYYQGKLEKRRLDHAIGGCRLFRRQCFLDIEGYQIYPSEYAEGDMIANTRAKLRDWKLCHFPDVKAIHQRPNLGVERAWKGGIFRANVMYYFDYHPLLMIGAAASLLTQKPYYHAFSFTLGYLKNLILRKEHIPDKEIRRFFRREKWKEIRRNPWIYFGE
jgi:glycosyltransferase involved in cell wall biosynthesis